MSSPVEIQSVMTLCPHSVGRDQDIEVAQKMMRQHGIHHLPVQYGGNLVGVVSDRDVKYATGWTKGSDTNLTVEDVYTPEPYVVEPTANLSEVLRKMIEDQIGCVLVAVYKTKLVGIFTTTDACRCLASMIEKQK